MITTTPQPVRSHKVSVVVALYNVRAELPVLLDSLCASTFTDFDVCVCDDASTDGSAEVLLSYGNRLEIRLVRHPENRGVTRARNAAMALAESPLLVFLDADVRVAPDTLEGLVRSIETTGADAVDGIYGPTALDASVSSRYYALFAHHSFLVADHPVEYNVFNAFCAICRREVMEVTGSHALIEKGVEVENETLGRRIVNAGFRLLLDPSIRVDHHWGGHRKLLFIFTRRIYWWVKIFFATGCRFEASMTTASYGVATLAVLPATCALLLAPVVSGPAFPVLAVVCIALFLRGYLPFLAFARRKRGTAYAVFAGLFSAYLALFAGASAIASGIGEVARLLAGRGFTIERRLFEGGRP